MKHMFWLALLLPVLAFGQAYTGNGNAYIPGISSGNGNYGTLGYCFIGNGPTTLPTWQVCGGGSALPDSAPLIGTNSSGVAQSVTALPSTVTTTEGNKPVGTTCTSGCATGQIAVLQSSTGTVVGGVNTGTVYGQAIANFGGLQFALAQNEVGAISGTMTGYVVGDSITLQCPSTTFTYSPTVAVTGVTSGSVTSINVVNPGLTTGSVPAGNPVCTQASTTGSGTGFALSPFFGVVAAYIGPAGLTTGGGAALSGSLYLNQNQDNDGTVFFTYGSENTFVGDKAGYGLHGPSFSNTTYGHNSCGSGAAQLGMGWANDAVGTTCIGNDAGRNISGSATYDTLYGWRAGANLSGSYDVFCGPGAGDNGSNTPGLLTGNYNFVCGYLAGSAMTSAAGDILLGAYAGHSLTTGTNDIILDATNGGSDVCTPSATITNELVVCLGAGPVVTVTGGGAPSSSAAAFPGIVSAGFDFLAPVGSTSAMSYGFTGDITTGIYHPAANQMALCSGGGCPLWVIGSTSIYLNGLTTGTNASYLCESSGSVMVKSQAPCDTTPLMPSGGRLYTTGTTSDTWYASTATQFESANTASGAFTLTLAAPSGDGEIRRVCFKNTTGTITYSVTSPATQTFGLPTTLAAGQCLSVIYNSVAGTPTNSPATTWLPY